MTSRERVLAAIERRETDRVPLDFWAEEIVWKRLLQDLNFTTKRELLEHFQIDLRWTDHRYIGPNFSDGKSGYIENMWGERFIRTDTGEQVACGGALDKASSFGEIENHHWPSNDWVCLDHLKEHLRRDDPYAILYGYADIWQRAAMVRGLDNMFFDMLERPDWVHYMTGRLADFYREDWIRAMDVSRGRIDIFLLISDLGSQNGPMMNLDLFRRFVKPRIQEMADLVHSFGKKLMFHSCGSVRLYIQDLIDAGVDILNPIQPSCKGMTPKELKKDFGKDLCFHGGMDIQTVLPHGTPEEVRQSTRQLIDDMKQGGGFILCPSHTLLPDIPTENIMAMYQEAIL
ncbi:MAG: hypothetical protein JXR73_12025 [Candidatus Omnitrophica bacterium]|nr:hypothetical protein [Candidatus Omnitrophota bacterium]